MEFLDEYESKPRFLLQSNNQSTKPHDESPNESHSSRFLSSLRDPTLLVSILLSIVVLALAFLYSDSEPMKSVLLWISMSLLLGPFAPISLTGGDIRVGRGPHLAEAPEEADAETSAEKPAARKSGRPPKKSPYYEDPFLGKSDDGFHDKASRSSNDGLDFTGAENEIYKDKNAILSYKESKLEKNWDDGDEELLKKLMVKHPVGKPGRWEAIAEGLKGRFKPENVIAKAKELGEKKADDRDSYQKFLKNRKVIDKRALDDDSNLDHQSLEGETKGAADDKSNSWSGAEDLALLNALKAFPKEVSMRWEKITAAVPGKSKAACMKRVAELKKGFRSAKASSSSTIGS